MSGPVQVGLKHNPIIGDFPERTEAEDLKPPAIREDRTIPSGEGVKSSQVPNELMTRPEVEVVCIAEDELHSHLAHLVRREGLHCAKGSAGHEDGGLHRPMGGEKPAAPSPGRIYREQLKGHQISTSSNASATR